MATIILNSITNPGELAWWQWGKLIGLVSMLLVGLGLYYGLPVPGIVMAISLHFFIDFTCQSDSTATGKANRDFIALATHSFISGGYAGFVLAGIEGLIISVLVHYVVDLCNKFGLPWPSGPIIDQALHIITIIAIAYYL